MRAVDKIIAEVERYGSCEITSEIEQILCCDLMLPELRLRGYKVVIRNKFERHIVKEQ